MTRLDSRPSSMTERTTTDAPRDEVGDAIVAKEADQQGDQTYHTERMSSYQQLGTQEGGTSAMSSVMGFMSSAKEKWDNSGANEALARATASVPESTRTYMSSMFKREHLRGITVYFGIGEERPFYLEKNPALLIERLRHNVSFFYLNYMVLTVILFLLTLLISPGTIVGMALLAIPWMWVIRSGEDGYIKIGSLQLPQKTVTLAMSGITLFVLMYLLSSIFWWTIFSSGFLCGAHALLRDASMHKDMDDVMAMEGDLHLGEDASFLNAQRVDQV